MKLAISLFVILFFICSAVSQTLSCAPLTETETTREGYFAKVVFSEKKPFRTLSGVVKIESGNEVASDVYVEIFSSSKGTENRIAGCRTGNDGKFVFSSIPDGVYTMRLSKDGGFQITDYYLRVLKGARSRSPIDTRIFLGK